MAPPALAAGVRQGAQVVDAFLAVSGGLKEAPANALPLAPRDLAEGMVLARDLVTRDGVMLLAADFVLDDSLIRQIREYERSEGGQVQIFVRT